MHCWFYSNSRFAYTAAEVTAKSYGLYLVEERIRK
jgi:hypothetical protein